MIVHKAVVRIKRNDLRETHSQLQAPRVSSVNISWHYEKKSGLSVWLYRTITGKLSKNADAWAPPRPSEIRSLGWAVFEKLFGRL